MCRIFVKKKKKTALTSQLWLPLLDPNRRLEATSGFQIYSADSYLRRKVQYNFWSTHNFFCNIKNNC